MLKFKTKKVSRLVTNTFSFYLFKLILCRLNSYYLVAVSF